VTWFLRELEGESSAGHVGGTFGALKERWNRRKAVKRGENASGIGWDETLRGGRYKGEGHGRSTGKARLGMVMGRSEGGKLLGKIRGGEGF